MLQLRRIISLNLTDSFPSLARLSSLTTGDSERKSSAGQQREPSLDIPVEGTGNCWVTLVFVVSPEAPQAFC